LRVVAWAPDVVVDQGLVDLALEEHAVPGGVGVVVARGLLEVRVRGLLGLLGSGLRRGLLRLRLRLGVRLGLRVGVGVGRLRRPGLGVGLGVRVGVGVRLWLGLGLGLGLRVGVRVRLGLGVRLGVRLRVGVGDDYLPLLVDLDPAVNT